MLGKWYQLYVRAPKGSNRYTTPEELKEVDDYLTRFVAASFVAPSGLPVQSQDKTWEVRVLEPRQLSIAKGILEHFGLEIAREVEND